MAKILIAYYSRHGSVANLAAEIAHGVESVPSAEAVIRCVPEVTSEIQPLQPPVPEQGPPYATQEDLKRCDGLILGSPAYFGNMAAAMKHFLDQSTSSWLSGALIGKPAGVFTSSSSMHGGQESVLLNMMTPLLHHGMLICGIPYSETSVQQTRSGVTPYGASHLAFDQSTELTEAEISGCMALGKRIAMLASTLSSHP